jgi:lipoyl(octanoyl) transferase
MRPLLATWLGRVDYSAAFALQQELAARRAAGTIPDVVLLLEHEAVYTIGRRGSEAEILFDSAALSQRGIAVEHTDRGGRVTYHGPGQLVGYPIIDLKPGNDLVGYVRALERAMIAAVAPYAVRAGTEAGFTGVWVGREKIAAIGVHVSRGVTTHGFALNVDPDLSAFNGIVPCGIVDRGVTSIAALVGKAPPIDRVGRDVVSCLARELGRALALVEPSSLGAMAHVAG